MDVQTQELELTTIYNEYHAFFPQCELIISEATGANSSINIRDNDQDIYATIINKKKSSTITGFNHISVVTQEGDPLIISVNVKGWHVIEQVSTLAYYETFEALMNHISPSFQLKFGHELSNRLNALSQLQP